MQYLGAISKNNRMISVCFQGQPFNITIIQVCAPTGNAEEAEVEWFYKDLQDLLELTPKRDVLFIIGDWNAKVGSQEIPGVNRRVWPWSTKWSRAKANRVFSRECIGHSKHPPPTTQEMTLHMDNTIWSISKPDWLYSLQPKMEKLYRVNRNKTWSWLWLRSWTPYCKIQTSVEENRENHWVFLGGASCKEPTCQCRRPKRRGFDP